MLYLRFGLKDGLYFIVTLALTLVSNTVVLDRCSVYMHCGRAVNSG